MAVPSPRFVGIATETPTAAGAGKFHGNVFHFQRANLV
jgi:hypothetical protein